MSAAERAANPAGKQAPRPRPRFSLLRFMVYAGFALLMWRVAGSSDPLPGQLLGAGMLLLAGFAAVFDPLSPTPADFRPRGALEWSAGIAAMAGIGLVFAGLYVWSR